MGALPYSDFENAHTTLQIFTFEKVENNWHFFKSSNTKQVINPKINPNIKNAQNSSVSKNTTTHQAN